MAALEILKPNCVVQGVLPNAVVTVVSVQWFGSGAIELIYKDAVGRDASELLYRDRKPDLEIVEQGRPWNFDGDGASSVPTITRSTTFASRSIASRISE
jgi:hypothetical protein